MEIPRHWREMPTNTSFTGREKIIDANNLKVFKFPGGEIPLNGNYEQIVEKFAKKGFTVEATNDILFQLWGRISSETPISLIEVVDGFYEFVGSEVGK